MEKDSKGRFVKGHSGGGRKIGALSKARLFDKLTEGHAEEIVATIIEDAKSGDGAARKLFMERYFPVSNMQMEQLERGMEELRELIGEVQSAK